MEYLGLLIEFIFIIGGVYLYLFSIGKIKGKNSKVNEKSETFRKENSGWLKLLSIALVAINDGKFRNSLNANIMSEINYADFHKVEMHVGTVVEANPYPEARKPALKLTIDFGETIGVKKTSAQITDLYQASDLIGSQVIAVTNFAPKQIGKFMSEVLVLGGQEKSGVVTLLRPDMPVPNGTRIA